MCEYLRFEPSQTFLPSPHWNVTCARGWQTGGGLYIAGTATLTNSNVYQNEARAEADFYIEGGGQLILAGAFPSTKPSISNNGGTLLERWPPAVPPTSPPPPMPPAPVESRLLAPDTMCTDHFDLATHGGASQCSCARSWSSPSGKTPMTSHKD